jgi:hypothetical protein
MHPPYKKYVIFAILRGGEVKRSKDYRKAPQTRTVVGFVLSRKALFGTRYFPSRKGWMLYDCRQAVKVPLPYPQHADYVGWQRSERVYPTEDAAVMHAIALTANAC